MVFTSLTVEILLGLVALLLIIQWFREKTSRMLKAYHHYIDDAMTIRMQSVNDKLYLIEKDQQTIRQDIRDFHIWVQQDISNIMSTHSEEIRQDIRDLQEKLCGLEEKNRDKGK